MPLVLVFSFYFLWKAFQKALDPKNSNNSFATAIAAGIIFGLGFYTYTGFRLAVLLLFGALVLWFLFTKKTTGKKNLLSCRWQCF